MKHLANILTTSRIVAAVCLLFAAVSSPAFWALYAWCGVSDMIDGTVARRTSSQSTLGARLDSVSDLVFVIACLVKIIPVIPLPGWLIAWIAIIALCKIAAYVSALVMHGRLIALHTLANKTAGLVIFLTVPAVVISQSALLAIPACALATFAAIQEGHHIRTNRTENTR